MMRHARPLGRRRLRSAHVQIAVHLPRVRRHDFGAEPFGQRQRQRRLPDRRRPRQHNQLQRARLHHPRVITAREGGLVQQTDSPLAVAVDLGGTRFRVALVGRQGDLHAHTVHATDAATGPDVILPRIGEAILRAAAAAPAGSRVIGVGIVAPGPVDPWRGVVYRGQPARSGTTSRSPTASPPSATCPCARATTRTWPPSVSIALAPAAASRT